jgi:transposase
LTAVLADIRSRTAARSAAARWPIIFAVSRKRGSAGRRPKISAKKLWIKSSSRPGPASRRQPLPDFDYIYRELKAHKKFNLTLDLLWREYKEQYPEGYQYTQFSVLYRRWQKKLDYSMRQDHRGGEKLFVDTARG